MKRFPPVVSDEKILWQEIKDPKEAMGYLNACVQVAFEEDDPELILLAIYNVAQSQGMQNTARAAKIHRVSLHRMLTQGGNPEWKSLFRVLSALHLTFKFDKQLPKAA